MNRTQFRQIVALTLLGTAASILVEVYFPGLLPGPIRQACKTYSQSMASQQPLIVLILKLSYFVGSVVAAFAAGIGLLFFRRWSLWLNAVLLAVAPFTWYLLDSPVTSWLASALAHLSTFGLGVLLAVAWFTPLRKEFR